MSTLIAQYLGVALAIGISVAWIVRRIIRRSRSKGPACGSCPDDCYCDLKNRRPRK